MFFSPVANGHGAYCVETAAEDSGAAVERTFVTWCAAGSHEEATVQWPGGRRRYLAMLQEQ
jgi:hypothetical protein